MKNALDLTRIALLAVIILSAGSWILSALHALNNFGYLALFLVFGITCWIWAKKSSWTAASARRVLHKLRLQTRHALPRMFLAICAFNFLGGIFNEITNGDSIDYRIPRILHWLSEGRWHWIYTGDERMNVIGANFEFLCAPLLSIFKIERLAFLVSFTAYLFIPGLTFSYLRRMGVAGRVAWWWMWLLAGGFVYAMQAGSVATDLISATFALASIVFGLRGAAEKNVGDLWLAILAAAFMSGIKQVTLPLGVILIIPILTGWRLLLSRPLGTLLVGMVALCASGLPIIIANIQYADSWKGFSSDNHYEQKSFFWGIIGNLITIPAQNLQPPIFPWADQWNDAMTRFVATPFGSHFSSFERFAAMWRAPGEINAGLGIGLTLLILATLAAIFRWRKNGLRGLFQPIGGYLQLVRWSPLLACAAWMGKSGLMQNARYSAPYYPFLLPMFLLHKANSRIVRTRWWQAAAVGSMALTLFLVATSRQRPILPAAQITTSLAERFPQSGFLRKVRNSFTFSYQTRIIKDEVRKLIPQDAKTVGYAGAPGHMEMATWVTAPNRKVHWILPKDTIDRPRALGVEYILVDASAIKLTPERSIDSWLQKFPGQVVGQFGVRPLPEAPPEIHYVVKLTPAPPRR